MTVMAAPRRILAAVDFGDASASAVAVAGTIAEAFGAQLTVLHAESLDVPPYFTSTQVEALEAERRQARAAAADYVRDFARQHTGAPVDPRVADGPAAEAVLAAAAGFDLLVLGTHGRRGASRWWLGSVAEAVVRGTAVPVLVTCALGAEARDHIAERLARLRAEPASAGAHWTDVVGQALDVPVHTADADSVVQALRTCGFPVLFVPDRVSAAQRSSS